MKVFRSSAISLEMVAITVMLFVGIPGLHAEDLFQTSFQPFAEKYCNRCHNSKLSRGELDLSRYTEISQVTKDFRHWNNIIEFIRGGEMPPEEELQPTIEERNQITKLLESILLEEAKKHAGDPGVILPRRLSNTEYDRSIHALTGIDIRPTRDFPADPAAGEGFDNTGEALGMSPNLLKKYLSAAQHVSEHMVLKTDGIAFSPFPVTSYNERKKLTEQVIIDFYQKHEVRIADYVAEAWRFRYQGEAEQSLDLAAWARQKGLSVKYLTLVSETLNKASASTGYLKQIGQLWEALPRPIDTSSLPGEFHKLIRSIEFAQRRLGHREAALIRSNAGNWPIAHLDFRVRTATQRDQFDPNNFKNNALVRFDRLRAPKENEPNSSGVSLFLRIDRAFDNGTGGIVILKNPLFSKSDQLPRNEEDSTKHDVVTLRSVLEQSAPELASKLSFGKLPNGKEIDADSFALQTPALLEIPLSVEMLRKLDDKHLLIPCELDGEQRESSVYLQTAVGRVPEDPFATNVEHLIHGDSALAKQLAESAPIFCQAFPNRFYYVDGQRGLAAGFHLVDGFFRDDLPLMQKVLDEQEQQELNRLWQELDFVTQSAEVLIRGFVWFERSERHVLHDERFDFLRPEDPLLVQDELLTRFETVYLEKLGVKLIAGTNQPQQPSDQYDLIHGFFVNIRAGLARYQSQLAVAEQLAQADLNVLAQRAYRRPLRAEETESLHALYQSLRKHGQSVEDSLRGMLTAILMSPNFFFHLNETPAGPGIHSLSNEALASRLSFFLWSSLPDEPLLAAAAAGDLQDETKLVAQMQRMLQDSKSEAFSREFFGQWLRYRDYLSKDPINAPSFPGYDEALRQAMFDEPVRLMTHLIQTDQPITELLHTDKTFVNARLAQHYGGNIEQQYKTRATKPDEWIQVEGLKAAGRGGLFGMGIVLTKTSKGERTSPIKRGFWTVHHLLGQHFPPPPVDVAELPPNEKDASKTIRELIVEHTANPRCAMCHTHFDSLGMALEGFDPVGRARTQDLGGRRVDDATVFPSGQSAKGIPGLIEYIEQHRKQDFVRTMCRKFLGYALGRSVLLSDQPLLIEMEAALEENDYRFSVLFETVVRSPQFRQQRSSD